ncbi:MAG: lysine--tRNA ligase [Bacilli bacterium]|nr:lysine--tRNA ligase [Bacilli bacterium]MDD4718790.1 lysine--tRNA ligase [Bacilli bacterium]
MKELNEQELIRRQKMEELVNKGVDPFGGRFELTSDSKTIKENFGDLTKEELEEKNESVIVAGRIMTKRGKGKAGFMHLQDNFGQIQIYVRQDAVGDDQYELFDKADLGDIIGIEGHLFRTNMGELSIKATKYTHLVKSLKPLPEKYHGIADPEIKLRKRYLDIIMDPEVKEIFRKKQIFWATIRNYLIENDFLEVETPVLENNAGGAAATPFLTHHNALDLDVFLRISMGELWQKKLLVAGYDRTFEIGRQFRNEGMSPEHLQDYTQMEFYWAYADYKDGMEFVKEMYRRVTRNVLGTSKFTSKGYDMDMDAEWKIYDFETMIKEGTGVSIYESTKEEIINKLEEAGVEFEPDAPYWRLVDILWKVVRKTLNGPGFLVGQPVELNPLPKRLDEDPRKVAQFQVILAGSEMGNGYSELNDAIDLENRFKEQREMAEAGDEEAHNHDAEFIEALEYGMPPAFGFGVSERLFSTLMDRPIRECVIFPLMRPINNNEK